MAKADDIFIEICNEIIDKGFDTKGEKVRTIWADTNEPAYYKETFYQCHTYDLREEFPIITLRKNSFYSPIEEVLWIYQKKSNNVWDLSTRIWDQWADDNGTIGHAYGYQIGLQSDHDGYKLDQTDTVLYDLKHNPKSRRIITTMYIPQELSKMNLAPCAYSCTFNVSNEDGKQVLNMLVNQRSQDMLVANSWNVTQYAALLMMIAQVSNMIPGKLVHMIANAHIYDRHIPVVKDIIRKKPYPAPIVTLDPEIKDFYDFTPKSFNIENYKYHNTKYVIPVAK